MSTVILNPLPYQIALRDFLREEDRAVWDWFAANRTGGDQAEAIRFGLLKNTYRVEREADERLYALGDEVAGLFELESPVTFYQSHNPQGLNAAVAFVPDEVHIIFEGPLKSKLSETELKAVLGHELAHFHLLRHSAGEFLVLDQMLAALTHDPQAHPAHMASASLFYLYNEIYCDRGSLAAVGDPNLVVSALVKLATGLDDVNGASYIRQAEEVFARGPTKTTGLTHPETYIRARAIKLWHDHDVEVERKIAETIEGNLALNQLDLLAQRKVSGLTRRLIDAILAEEWMHTDSILAQARLYFPEYRPPHGGPPDVSVLAADLHSNDQPLVDYYCYVMLDFVTADRELEVMPLAAALQLSEQLGFKDRMVEIAKKELRLAKKQFDKIDKEKAPMLSKAATEGKCE